MKDSTALRASAGTAVSSSVEEIVLSAADEVEASASPDGCDGGSDLISSGLTFDMVLKLRARRSGARELRDEVADAEGRFVAQDFAGVRAFGRDAERDEHRAVAALAREPPQRGVNLLNSRGRVRADGPDDLLVELVRVGVKARGRAALEPVAQVAARDERRRSPRRFDCAFQERAEMHVVFVGEEAVAERDDAALPAVALEEVERDCRAVVEFAGSRLDDTVALFVCRLADGFEQFLVERRGDGCLRGAEVGKIAAQGWAAVGDEGALFERRVRRHDDARFSAARIDALGEAANRLD